MNIILSDISLQLAENGKLTDLKESDIARLNKFTINNLKNNIDVAILDKTTTFVIEYSDSNAKVAQTINSIVIQEMYEILEAKDQDNILGAKGKDLSYSINREASLPTSPIPFHSSSSIMSIIKIALVSLLIYIVIVVVYDFLFAYVTNKNKASTMIKTEMISEIKMPYFKYREKKKEQ
ncbi:MAG: hypothetical protein K2P12_02055 [Clostridia bacterium]|nr:hypothetical protein [Clostridia bacterium]